MSEDARQEQWAIWAVAGRVADADYNLAATLIHDMEEGLLLDMRTNLEFMLDMVSNEQRERKNAE